MLYLKEKELGLEIIGYEKYRSDDDDSWAHVNWEVNNGNIKFKNESYDIESVEVEHLRDKLKRFISGEMKDYECFVPIEDAFKVRFYPKGDEYGCWLKDSKSNEFLEKKIVEIVVYPVDFDDGAIDKYVGASFILNNEETAKLYNYLFDITE